MADLNRPDIFKDGRNYDALDRVLAAQPRLKAPRHTAASVLNRIASQPQIKPSSVSMLAGAPVKYPVPVIKYAPPVALPLPDLAEEVLYKAAAKRQRQLVVGLAFTSLWVGLCLFGLWLVWPAVSNLVFGPSSDPEMQVRLANLQNAWNTLTRFLSDFLSANGAILPTLISAAVGLGLMTAIFYSSSFNARRQFRLE